MCVCVCVCVCLCDEKGTACHQAATALEQSSPYYKKRQNGKYDPTLSLPSLALFLHLSPHHTLYLHPPSLSPPPSLSLFGLLPPLFLSLLPLSLFLSFSLSLYIYLSLPISLFSPSHS